MNEDNRELYARFDRDVTLIPSELRSHVDLSRYSVSRDGTAEFSDRSGYQILATVDRDGVVQVQYPRNADRSRMAGNDQAKRMAAAVAKVLFRECIAPLRKRVQALEVSDRIDEEFIGEMAALCDRVKQVEDRTLVPRGYWREGGTAKRNELFSHNGSAWLCQRSTTEKPCVESPDWMRIARAGRDGRDAR